MGVFPIVAYIYVYFIKSRNYSVIFVSLFKILYPHSTKGLCLIKSKVFAVQRAVTDSQELASFLS